MSTTISQVRSRTITKKKSKKFVDDSKTNQLVNNSHNNRNKSSINSILVNNNNNNNSDNNKISSVGNLANGNNKIRYSISLTDILAPNGETFHKRRDSLLSSASGFINYRGILNLCIVLLVMSSGRLVLENLLKYGFLVRFDAPVLFIKDPTAWPSLLAVVCSNIFIMFALNLERKMATNRMDEKLGIFLSVSNVLACLILPAIYLWYRQANPLSSFFALATYSCLSMKLFSYLQVNKALRDKQKQSLFASSPPSSPTTTSTTTTASSSAASSPSTPINNNNNNIVNFQLSRLEKLAQKSSSTTSSSNGPTTTNGKPKAKVDYPNNLTKYDIYYFIFAPTLCYELNFPKASRIRKSFLIRRLVEFAFLTVLQMILLQQWIVPIIQNSQLPFRETNIFKIIERLLKLAIPNHVCWLIMFYSFFHSYLNLIAELLRFGDREFYRDWWNAETVSQFWKNWNVPVHAFCSRHIYKPLLRMGLNKFQASLMVFFVSAFFHEYLVSIPLRMFRLWAFFGMVLQIPFAAIVNKYLHGNYGNMAVWVSLIIGQPIAIMMYIHDYYFDYYITHE